ncbi:MAG TPA: DNA-binding response regulator [Rhodospirillaceae bacterium]|nr:DNA-binding response regulator [Rhodospirillaceae bacterium]
MKILVVDRDELVGNKIKSKLAPLGHDVVTEIAKNNAVERISAERYDVLFFDPSPLTLARTIVLNIRRIAKHYPYIILTSESASRADAIKSGCNDVLAKPIDVEALEEKIRNAAHMHSLVRRIGDDSEDFPSAGGVIAKSAFNQLFLSAIDRADRYGERTYVLFITMRNYESVRDLDGPYAADYAVAKLSQYLVRLRRQSDIIGQTEKYEYALLLQWANYDSEPVEAANRFAEALSNFKDIVSSGAMEVEIAVTLVDLPVGSKLVEHVVRHKAPGR